MIPLQYTVKQLYIILLLPEVLIGSKLQDVYIKNRQELLHLLNANIFLYIWLAIRQRP